VSSNSYNMSKLLCLPPKGSYYYYYYYYIIIIINFIALIIIIIIIIKNKSRVKNSPKQKMVFLILARSTMQQLINMYLLNKIK